MIKLTKESRLQFGLSALLFIVAWCFWSVIYPQAVAFQEQICIFLFDEEQFAERISMPGGIARYIAEFLIQFYNKIWIGGFIIAMYYLLLQLGTWFLVKKNCKPTMTSYVLSFLPSLMLWLYMGDERVKATFVIAILLALGAMILCPAKEKKIANLVYLLVMIPLLSWIAGPTVLVFVGYVFLRDIRKPFDYIGLAAVIYVFACLLATSAIAPVPLRRVFMGVNYSMEVEAISYFQTAIMVIVAVAPLLIAHVPAFKQAKNDMKCSYGLAAVFIVLMAISIPSAYTSMDYEVMKYDMLVRSQRWNDVIEQANSKTPSSPLTVAMLNLALAQKGELADRGFDYYQNGWEGAFPSFNRMYVTSLMTGEIYFYLGLVNSAQRMVFEANEGLPDNAKSARIFKRLAETNIINGDYEAAKKYIKILKKTMFYRGWADMAMKLLYNEKAINEHPLYGKLRKFRLPNDFMFSDTEIDKIMGQLIMHDNDNYLAVQYLLFLPQLEGNQQKFYLYSDFVKKQLQNKRK